LDHGLFPAQRDELFKKSARALFRGGIDALYEVVTPDFVWSFHDGPAATKSLANVETIRAHLAEQKALFSAQRFHDVPNHHAGDMIFMTFRVSETVRATGEQRKQRGFAIRSGMTDSRLRTSIAKPIGPD
jgi:ketosteroid isomerase-like protein